MDLENVSTALQVIDYCVALFVSLFLKILKSTFSKDIGLQFCKLSRSPLFLYISVTIPALNDSGNYFLNSNVLYTMHNNGVNINLKAL